jgi:hypothetical protein
MSMTSEDEDYLREHRNRVYLKIRANLPGDFEQFSHEMLTEMIFGTRNFTVDSLMLREDLIEKYKESPRDFMLDMLEEIKKKCDTCIELLQCKKCGIDLPLGERSA